MKKTKQAPGESPNRQLTRVTRMLHRMQPWLQSQRARVPTFAEMERWTGISEGTIRDWFGDEGKPTAEFLLALIERTPEKARLELLNEFCRVYPTLNHPLLASDQTVVSRLTTLLSQTRAFTYIQGGSAEMRTFLITALGHSFWSLTRPPKRVLGVDVHAPDWFVPVSGVVYLDNIFRRDELLRSIEASWPQLRNGETPLLIFNGVWSALPNIQEKIRALASRCHVLVAEESAVDVNQPAKHLPLRSNIITINTAAAESKSIGLRFQTL